jgi:hypothetical protein
VNPVYLHVAHRLRALNERVFAMKIEVVPATSWCAEFSTDGGLTWATNALRFETKAEAQAYGADLAMRWTAVTGFVASPRTDPVNRVWDPERGIGYLPDLLHHS